jgi:signal transduction histidine kinase
VDELLTFTVEQLQAGVTEIRALVYGILPSALVSGGLPAALAELPDVAVDCALDRRLEPDIESAAWFAISEGVANAHKHAPGAPVTVRVQIKDLWLYVEVCDHGPGGARNDGDGLRSLADRIEAHGGRLRIDSPSGQGTRLVVELPCG